MNVIYRITNNLVSIVVAFIFLLTIFNCLDKKDKKNCIYILLVAADMIELIVETLTCILNGLSYSLIIPITTILHMILFFMSPVVTYLWYLFTLNWVNKDKNVGIRKFIMLIPLIFNGILVLINPLINSIFYISNNNIYRRGFMFIIPMSTTYFYLLYSLIILYRYRYKLSETVYLPLMLFCIFPAVGGLIQSLFYGLLLMWSATLYSLIIAFIYLQQQMLQTDRLTGAWRRQKLINHLSNIARRGNSELFSIIFIDLDRFKEINDKYGHGEGDKALITLVSLVKSTLRKGDFITRYGGDEFIIFLNVNSNFEVDIILNRITALLTKYNEESKKPYKISFSHGYEVFDKVEHMSVSEYINIVDKLMYEAKKNKN